MSNNTQLSQTQNTAISYMDKSYVENVLLVANQFYQAKCFGSDVQNAHQAFVKIQAGAEMGMKPMEAMNSLYIVNGKITIWGSAQIKALRNHGWKVTFPVSTKTDVTCRVEKGDEVYEETYNIADLPAGSKAKGFAPMEKLRYHAVSRIIRFNLPEVLDIGTIYSVEEAEDMDKPELPKVSHVATAETVAPKEVITPATAKDFLDAVATEKNTVEATEEAPTDSLVVTVDDIITA